MDVEVLVSTMNQKDYSLVDKMNITSKAVVINQIKENTRTILDKNKGKIKFLSFYERGLSISRNRAIDNAVGDICILADDDVVYKKNYEKKILNAYKQYPNADVIIFKVDRTYGKKKYSGRVKKVGFVGSLKAASVEITFKLKSIKKNQIKFNPLFGAGSGCYISGEENIFLLDCIRNDLNIIYYPEIIGTVYDYGSTWFQGYNKDFFITKGAFFKEALRFCSYIGILRFAVRKYSTYKGDIGFFEALRYMFQGTKEYKLKRHVR